MIRAQQTNPFSKLHSSPPARHLPTVQAQEPKDRVELSAGADRSEEHRSWGKVALGVLALGGTIASLGASPATAQIAIPEPVMHQNHNFRSMPFNLSRQADGDVVVAFDQGDRVVNPTHNSVYDSPRAAFEANYSRGRSLCSQAVSLGGKCVTPSLAFIPNGEHGTIQVEQINHNTISVGSMELMRNSDGVYVDRPGPDLWLGNDGHVSTYPQ